MSVPNNLQHILSSGELIGGLDIIKEMVESGELQTMLPKKVPLMHYPHQLYEAAINILIYCNNICNCEYLVYQGVP